MSINAGFHKLKIAEVRRETSDAVSIVFEIPQALVGTFAFKAGQHLTLRTMLAGEELRRNYSVCAAPHENEIRIAVKQMPGGRDMRHPAHACSWGKGSIGCEPFAYQPSGQISKCRCGPSASPVAPTLPSAAPEVTASPSLTSVEPSSRCMKT